MTWPGAKDSLSTDASSRLGTNLESAPLPPDLGMIAGEGEKER